MTSFALASDISRTLELNLSNREVQALAAMIDRSPAGEVDRLMRMGKQAVVEELLSKGIMQRRSSPSNDR